MIFHENEGILTENQQISLIFTHIRVKFRQFHGYLWALTAPIEPKEPYFNSSHGSHRA